MIPDIIEKLVGSKIEEELKKLKEGGMSAAELEAIAAEARTAFAERARKLKSQTTPLFDAAKEALRQALGVPSRAELASLTERLERALAALERAQAEAEAAKKKS
jgi:hypothetical protein